MTEPAHSTEDQKKKKLIDFLINSVRHELESISLPADSLPQAAYQALEKAYLSTRLQLPDPLRDEIFRQVLHEVEYHMPQEIEDYGPIQP